MKLELIIQSEVSQKEKHQYSILMHIYGIQEDGDDDVQAGFRKGRGTRDQIANIHWIMKKQESHRKASISALLTMPKPLTVQITINCGKF